MKIREREGDESKGRGEGRINEEVKTGKVQKGKKKKDKREEKEEIGIKRNGEQRCKRRKGNKGKERTEK